MESNTDSTSPRDQPQWISEASMLDQLAPETALPGYRVRAPHGYHLDRLPTPGGGSCFVWAGTMRADGTAPQLMVTLVLLPPGEETKYTKEQLLDEFLKGIQRRRLNWNRMPAEYGLLNGIPFLRARWAGIDPTQSRKLHGFCYVTLDERTILQIASQDFEEHHEAALRRAEAAALTFRKELP